MNSKASSIVLGCAATLTASSASEKGRRSRPLEQIKALIGNWTATFQWTGGRDDSGPMNTSYCVTGNGSAEQLPPENYL